MKKLLISVIVALGVTPAFAQEVFKQVSKIKDYNEAKKVLEANLGSMSAEEKAKCYNALVDLSYKKVVAEQATITSNQMAEQLKTKVEQYDTVGFYSAVYNALFDANKCDEFDNQPNEKGKVKPKFRDGNAERLYGLRPNLINGGIHYQGLQDDANFYKYIAGYVESADFPLFAKNDKAADANLLSMAYYAALGAYRLNNYEKAEQFADIAIADPEIGKDALNIKLTVMQSQIKTHEDSLAYVKKLEALYAQDENNESVFGVLCGMHTQMGDNAAAKALVDAKLAKDPKNFTALANRGQMHMNESKWDEAIADFKAASEAQPANAGVIAYVGYCYMLKAQAAANAATANNRQLSKAAEDQIVAVYKEAIPYLEKAKELDTTMQFKSVWGYSLYTCYYVVYGADDPRTQAIESIR